MATPSTGLAANRSAADSLPGGPPLGVRPCPQCLRFFVLYRPSLDPGRTIMKTYQPHAITGPETRRSTAPFSGGATHSPIAPGTYALHFDFTREDLRFASLAFTAVMHAPDKP